VHRKGRWSLRRRVFGSSGRHRQMVSLPVMTYVIGSACVDVMDKSCVQECPVDCIYEGARSMYINPDECVDCGACKLICRMDAIYYETDLPDDEQRHLTDNAAFFRETLPGRDHPLGSPGGAANVGPLGVDTPLVAAQPAAQM
jgi:NAD-dependent dihydropyrimidine dehydrogenase PreA subunit